MDSKLRFLGLFSVFFLLVSLVSCSKSSSTKCFEDNDCQLGAYCSADSGKCAKFEEYDYTIVIKTPEDGATVCGNVMAEIALNEVSEKLHDGMDVAVTVAKDRNLETLKGTFSKNTASFELDFAEAGEYKLSAFLIHNPYKRAGITLYCDSDQEPGNDTDTTDDDDAELSDDDVDFEPVDNDTDTGTADENDADQIDDVDVEPVDNDSDTGTADESDADQMDDVDVEHLDNDTDIETPDEDNDI